MIQSDESTFYSNKELKEEDIDIGNNCNDESNKELSNRRILSASENTNIDECDKRIAITYNLYDDIEGWNYNKISKDTINLLNSDSDTHSLCVGSYPNCKLTEKTNWKNTNSTGDGCLTVDISNGGKVTLQNGKPYGNDYNEPFVINKESASSQKLVCEERWYDWFTIPDYHNGNKYSLGVDQNGKISSFNYCYQGYILTENGKCIKRSKFDYGKVKNFIHYTPYALIFLLGLTKEDIIDLHKKEMEKNKINSNEILYDAIYNNKDILNLIYLDIKKVIKDSISRLLNEPLTYVNIVPPYNDFSSENEINYNPEIKYQDPIYLEKAYNIAKNIKDFNNDIFKLNEYKEKLEEVSGLKQNSVDFSRQFAFLQKACSICFSIPEKKDKMYDIFDKYSSKIIENVKKINQNYNYIAVPKLTEVQILKQSNPKDNRDNSKIDKYFSPTTRPPIVISEDTLLFNSKTHNIYGGASSPNPINLSNGLEKIIKTKSDIETLTKLKKLSIDIDLINNSLSSVFIKSSNLFILSILMIIWLFCVILLLLKTWKYFAYVFNYIIYGFIFCIYGFFAIFLLIFRYRATNFRGVILKVHKMSLQFQLKTLYATIFYSNHSKGFFTRLVLIIGTILIIVLIVKELIKIGNILSIKSYPPGYSLQPPYIIKKGGYEEEPAPAQQPTQEQAEITSTSSSTSIITDKRSIILDKRQSIDNMTNQGLEFIRHRRR